MEASASQEAPNLVRRLTLPVALAVAAVVGTAWYVTWSTTDLSMALLASPMSPAGTANLALFFVLIMVMMVAMMLPSALPMVLTYNGLTRLDRGQPTKPADRVASGIFASAYFVVWGLVGSVALVGLLVLGVLGPFSGLPLLVPSAVLLAAGAYQFTRAKEACLRGCQSPMGFVMTHWRSGRRGAWRMGLDHAAYCIGCCWLFMLVLFVAGAMSLVWMGAISVAIFIEKVGWRPVFVSRGIGVVLVAVGVLFAVQGLAMR